MFVFLPLTLLIYYLLPRLGGGVRSAALWLSVMSLVFYSYWDIRYLPLLLGSICWNFWIGRFIEHMPKCRKIFLIIGIMGNLVLLAYFKYTAFFVVNIDVVFGFSYEIPKIILPLGISFFTFTQTAYLVDAYRGETKGYSFLTYLEFVTIFPHLIAGPIINHHEMIPQFLRRENLNVNWKNLALGLSLFIIGLFKKVIIADNLSPWANNVFSRADSLTLLEAWIGSLSYTFQLYFDFSGYSEMAIGLGLLFNLHFPVNFNSPYQSGSIIEFWRRWHMTLGLWVKNYLYIPMGGNRHGQLRKMRNLLVSMLIVGFWHGAGWTFVIWGGMHGIALVINHYWHRLAKPLPKPLACTFTFLTVLCLWVFFRAETVGDALTILGAMFDFNNVMLPAGGFWEQHLNFLNVIGITFAPWHMPSNIIMIGGSLLILGLILCCCPNPLEICRQKDFNIFSFSTAVFLGLMLAISLIFLNQVKSEFLYFQF